MKFQNTKEAIKEFKDSITCAQCEKPVKNLQYLGNACKHAFCWDCISEITNSTKKRRGFTPLCPRCAMQLNLNKITGATLLNNCSDLLDELDIIVDGLEKREMTEKEILCTQRVFENFDNDENRRTVDEFLLTQPADDISEEKVIRDSSASPELDVFTDYEAIQNKQTPKTVKEEKPIRSSVKRSAASLFDENEDIKPHKRVPVVSEKLSLFDTQIITKKTDVDVTPFLSRKSSELHRSSFGLVSMFSDRLQCKKEPTPPAEDDVFSKKVINTRRASTVKTEVKVEEGICSTRNSRAERRSTRLASGKKVADEVSLSERRSYSPASIEKLSAKSERRSSFGTRRGEVIIVNSILNNRIPQLKSAIEAGTGVNERDNEMTPLYVAVQQNNLPAARILIDAGAIINATCLNSCETVLHEAVRQNNAEMTDYLLSRGASMKTRNSWGQTAEELIPKDDLNLKKVFEKYRNFRVLQTVIPPRKPHINFVQLINEKMLTEVEKRKLPGKLNLVGVEMDGATHLVVNIEPNTDVLTIGKENVDNILKAIIRPGMIVSVNWLKDCIRDARKVDEDRSYLVRKVRWMDGETIEGSIEMWKKTNEKMTPKLFHGCKFFFLRSRYSFLDRVTLIDIVRAGGAQVYSREPAFDATSPPPYHNRDLQPNFIVYSLSHDVHEKYRDSSKFTLVCEQWIIESILRFSILSPY